MNDIDFAEFVEFVAGNYYPWSVVLNAGMRISRDWKFIMGIILC
jgi:hypothetical protein